MFCFSGWSGSHHVFCATFGDELKFTSILSIPQTPKGHPLCAPDLVRRDQADVTGKCRSLPVQNQAASYVIYVFPPVRGLPQSRDPSVCGRPPGECLSLCGALVRFLLFQNDLINLFRKPAAAE